MNVEIIVVVVLIVELQVHGIMHPVEKVSNSLVSIIKVITINQHVRADLVSVGVTYYFKVQITSYENCRAPYCDVERSKVGKIVRMNDCVVNCYICSVVY